MPSKLERIYQCEACELEFKTKEKQDKHNRDIHTNNHSSSFEKKYQAEASEID